MARILVADDNEGMRNVLEATLHQGGHEVLPPATDGAEALAFARAYHPDAVLLDAMMPRVHGFDVCRQLKADPATRAIRVVMVTAKSAAADRAEGLAAGADAYVTKPFSPRALLELLAASLAADGRSGAATVDDHPGATERPYRSSLEPL